MSLAKLFSERLNQCLTETGAPKSSRERAAILSKMLDISKHEAWAFIEGQQFPKADLLEKIALEFEVDPDWLSGKK